MRGHHVLIALAIFVGWASPTLADTLNSFRKAHGLPALHRSGNLQAMAQRHAHSMAARRSMNHDGFYSQRGPRGARAENVAYGCSTESCAMRMWRIPADTGANMLLSDVKSYGLASASGGRDRYWCMIVGG
jgi:uncharacterized protein YkwD